MYLCFLFFLKKRRDNFLIYQNLQIIYYKVVIVFRHKDSDYFVLTCKQIDIISLFHKPCDLFFWGGKDNM